MSGYDYRVVETVRVDGDTVDLVIDLGFHLTSALRFRMLAIDTPERSEPGWKECTAYTRMWLEENAGKIRAETYKADSFGRWLAYLYVPGGGHLSTELADFMSEHDWTSPAVR